jgi:hypothetical protein
MKIAIEIAIFIVLAAWGITRGIEEGVRIWVERSVKLYAKG